jgi:hypothetical protein
VSEESGCDQTPANDSRHFQAVRFENLRRGLNPHSPQALLLVPKLLRLPLQHLGGCQGHRPRFQSHTDRIAKKKNRLPHDLDQ